MTVYERVMSQGRFEVVYSAPADVVRQVVGHTPYAHLLVTPTWIPANTVAYSTLESAARYRGVVLDVSRERIGGHGLAWWLGDENADGDVIATRVSSNAQGFSTLFSTVAGDTEELTSTGNQSDATAITSVWVFPSRRQVIDAISKIVDSEWKIDPDGNCYSGDVDYLYGASPAVMATPGGGRDIEIVGFPAEFTRDEKSWRQYASSVYVLGSAEFEAAGSGGQSSFARDSAGNLVTRWRTARQVDIGDNAQSVANSLLNLYASSRGRREATIVTPSYDVRGDGVEAGGRIYVYDPDNDFYDTANQVWFDGTATHPLAMRVVSVEWPVEAGMGVYLHTHDGTSDDVLDLTPWVRFESPGATLEVVDGGNNTMHTLGLGGDSRSDQAAQHRLMLTFGTNKPFMNYTKSSQTIAGGGSTKTITYDGTEREVWGSESSGVVTPELPGWYEIAGWLWWDSSGSGGGVRRIQLVRNSTVLITQDIAAADNANQDRQFVKWETSFNGITDTCELKALQTSGGNLDVEARIQVQWLRHL